MALFGKVAYRRVAEGFFALLSVALLVLAGYVWLTYRDINNGVTRLPVSVGVRPTGTQDDIDRSDQNLLVVGIDDRSNMTNSEVKLLKVGRDGGSLNTDTMMLVHIPADGSKATLISLPRDSYVHIPGYGWNRLNSAYADGYTAANGTTNQKRTAGADLLIKTVTNLTGLTIDHYVQVSFMGFYDLANAIGGITVNLCDSVDDTVAYNRSQGVTGGSGFKMSKGVHHLNPVQSLEFVRQRHNFPNGLGDLDRVRREQYFLTAAFRKVASIGMLFKLASLGDALKRNVYLDNGLNLLDLAKQMESLSADNIVGETIPTTPATIDGNDVLRVIPKQIHAFVKKVINPPAHTAAPGRHAHKHRAIDAKCIS
jgi:LCP family protein required for cell wall assembly